MSRFFFISPIGYKTPGLFDSFIETFQKEGHQIVDEVEKADCFFIDLHTRVGVYGNEIKYAVNHKLPVVIYDINWDYGGMSRESFPYLPNAEYQELVFDIGMNCPNLWFVRKLENDKHYAANVYPIELCYYKDCDFEPATKDELFNRPYDIAFCGNASPERVMVVNALIGAGKFKVKYHWTNENGKLPHTDWISFHRDAKMFFSCNGGGLNDERAYQLFSVAAMLKYGNNQLVKNDFLDMLDCVKFFEHSRQSGINAILSVIKDPDWLYEVYIRGIEKIKKYYTEEYRANYVLETIKTQFVL